MRAFDEIEYVREAEQNGCSRSFAEFQARELQKIRSEFFTKPELINIFSSIQKDLKILQYQLLIKLTLTLGGFMGACTGLLAYLIKH